MLLPHSWARALIALLSMSSLQAAAQTAASPPPPIRIGLILPLTGGSSDMGNSAKVGAELAVKEINEVGGYLGRPLELLIRNDESKPDVGLAHAEELVLKEHVVATVGFCNTGVAAKALDVFQKAKSVLIVPCATGTVLTAKFPAQDSYIFRNAPNDALQTEFLAAELARRSLSKPALIVDTSGYGDAGLKDLQAALARRNITPATVLRFPVGVKSLYEEVVKARESGADSIIGWTVGPESGVLASARVKAGWKVPHLGPWGLSHRSALETSKGDVEGAMMVQTMLPNIFLERNVAFLVGYNKLSKESPIGSIMSAAQTYDAVQLLLRGLFNAKSGMSGTSIKQALENLPRTYPGVVTTYDKPFSSSDHDAISGNMLWLGTWRQGERAYVYNEDAKKASLIRRKE
jgi:branched-chain amino acid transport system substrate-binding protein